VLGTTRDPVSSFYLIKPETAMRTLLIAALLAACSLPLSAQERPDPATPDGENLQTPLTWEVRLDEPTPDVAISADKEQADIYFVNMTPGWHITTGPAAIFYHPGSTAEGTYRAEATIHLFDPGDRQREAFGMLIGGQNLDGDEQQYDYFVIRNTGEFLIKRRDGSDTSMIQDWTPSDAIKTYGPDAGDSVPNTLAVEAGPETVTFSINGTEVASLPRSEVHTDGVVGLRVNHHLNLHVADLAVTPL
jgi:hypothetical protein